MTTEQDIMTAFEEDGGMDGLTSWLAGISADCAEYAPEDIDDGDGPCIDVRLRYHDDSFYTYSGDSSYDQDHRGFWGASSVGPGETEESLLAIAGDLFEQVLEHAAQNA